MQAVWVALLLLPLLFAVVAACVVSWLQLTLKCGSVLHTAEEAVGCALGHLRKQHVVVVVGVVVVVVGVCVWYVGCVYFRCVVWCVGVC